MDLKEKLIQFYKKSTKLDRTKLKFKNLKKSVVKLNNQDSLTISRIQEVIDEQVKMKKYSDLTAKLSSELIGIQREIIKMLKDIGFPGKKKISIKDKLFGSMDFWFEGTYLYFEKPN